MYIKNPETVTPERPRPSFTFFFQSSRLAPLWHLLPEHSRGCCLTNFLRWCIFARLGRKNVCPRRLLMRSRSPFHIYFCWVFLKSLSNGTNNTDFWLGKSKSGGVLTSISSEVATLLNHLYHRFRSFRCDLVHSDWPIAWWHKIGTYLKPISIYCRTAASKVEVMVMKAMTRGISNRSSRSPQNANLSRWRGLLWSSVNSRASSLDPTVQQIDMSWLS